MAGFDADTLDAIAHRQITVCGRRERDRVVAPVGRGNAGRHILEDRKVEEPCVVPGLE